MKLIIFDLDGTLADTTDDLGLAMVNMLSELGFAQRTREELRSFISLGARDFVRSCLPNERQGDEALVDAALEMYLKKYEECCVVNTSLYGGVLELVDALREGGYTVCVLSNKPHALTVKIVDTLLPGRAATVLGAGQFPLKPSPNGALYIAQSHGVRPEDCILVGDSELDFETAENAKMPHICVSYGYRTREQLALAGAACIVDRPSDIAEAVYNLN